VHNSYTVAQLIDDTCPQCGRYLAMQSRVEDRNERAIYLLRCTGRRCGYRRVKRVFRVVQTA